MNNNKNYKAILIQKNSTHKQLDLKSINSYKKEDGLLWIDLDSKLEINHHWLHSESNVDEVVLEALLAEDTRPRYFIHNNGFLLILRGVNLNPGTNPDDMVSLRIWIERGRIITIWRRNVAALNDLKKEVLSDDGPITEGEFVSKLAKVLSIRMGDAINNISDQIDEMEDVVFDDKEHLSKTVLSEIRRQIIKLRRHIAPQKDVVAKIQEENFSYFDKNDLASLRETKDRLTRFLEELDASKERSAVVRDEIENQLNKQMNQTMYLLSIVTVIFLPLGLITGLLGINVAGIPYSQNPFAFAFVCVVLILIAIIEIILFKSKKWM